MKIMSSEETLQATLAVLKQEHQRLDAEVALLSSDPRVPSLELQRLKRQKLALKDKIKQIQDRLNPDIIA